MPAWSLTVHLADLIADWKSHDDIPRLAKEVVKRIKESGWRELTPYPHTFDEYLAELEKSEDEIDYVGRWETLYDLADSDQVWIEIVT